MDLKQRLQDNIKMKEYFEVLSNGKKIDSAWKECQDALGLTPLHYALILGNDKIFLDMMKSKFRLFSKEQYRVYESQCPYDLCVWAEYLGKNYTEDIFFYTSYEAKSLTSMIKIEKAHLFVQNRAIEMSRKMESVQRKRIRQARQKKYQGLFAEESKLRRILDNRCVLEREKRDIESTLYDLESELEQLRINKKKYWSEQAKNLRYTEYDFEKKIREIIENPHLLLKYLVLEMKNWKSFRYFKSEIFIPNDWNVSQKTNFQNDNFEETSRKNTEDEPVCKPYGDKWFSPQARRDRNVLKREYRELGKKYHPDNSKNVNATAIFQDILAERMEILENFK